MGNKSANITLPLGLDELFGPLHTVKCWAYLHAFVWSVVVVNLVIYPLGGAYDPSDFFHTVLKDLPLLTLYAFLGMISLFVFVYWLFFMPSGHLAVPEKAPSEPRPPVQAVIRQALYHSLLACRAPPVSV